MELTSLDLNTKEIEKLNKKGFHTVEDIQSFFPRTYHDFSEIKMANPSLSWLFIALKGKLESVESQKKNEILMLKAKVIEEGSGTKIHVMWIGSYYLKKYH